MPGLDGYQVCQRLKQEPSTRDIPVIFVTAKDETEDVVQGFIGINLRNFSFNLRVTNALN
ncbi:response regulator [bacterium]|nr:response regulator [bacterium]